MTIIDTSGVIDYLLGWRTADEVKHLLSEELELRAPDLLVFEVLSALRRQTLRDLLPAERARAALVDLGDLPMRLYESGPLRLRAWELRENMAAGDASVRGSGRAT